MATANFDFDGVAAELLQHSHELVSKWLPNGKRHGHEWTCGNLRGDPGGSLSINLITGVWCDFADKDVGGSDLISLYAAINGLSQLKAAKELIGEDSVPIRTNGNAAIPNREPESRPNSAPIDYPSPRDHHVFGAATKIYEYFSRDLDSGPLFLVCRYEPPSGKEFWPWTWRNGAWALKGYPAPRPIYRLRELLDFSTLPVIVVEGEKCADELAALLPSYSVVTWCGGAKGVDKSDWSPLNDRVITLWPDADEPGNEAMARLAGILIKAGTIPKVMRVTDKPKGWDVADAISEGWGVDQLNGFIVSSSAPVSNVTPITKAKRLPKVDEAEGSRFVKWDEMGLQKNGNNAAYENVSNVSLVFQRHPAQAGHIWFDNFRGRVYHNLRGKDEQWTDADDTAACIWIQQQVGFNKISTGVVREGIAHAARQNTHNSLMEWLESLVWDGTPRLDDWLHDCLGVDRNPYSRAVARNWPIAMVARAFNPGCQMDNMPVLEGRMGRGKSSFLEALGHPWFASLPDEFGSKDFLQAIQGRWLIEVPDMTGFSKREHTHILAIITRRNDPYRASYGRLTEDHPRVSVFAATSETDDYLQDPRGVRRYWPLRCGSIDLDALHAVRGQVFAEAVQAYQNSATWYVVPEIATLDEQRERITKDPWEGQVLRYCNAVIDANKLDSYVKVEVQIDPILSNDSSLAIPKDRQTRREVVRVASILRDLGWIQAWPKDPVTRKTRAVWIPDPKLT